HIHGRVYHQFVVTNHSLDTRTDVRPSLREQETSHRMPAIEWESRFVTRKLRTTVAKVRMFFINPSLCMPIGLSSGVQ
ncbi:MAG: hypothetical protein ACXW3Z_08445, partial [Limisphaerales bacterium]